MSCKICGISGHMVKGGLMECHSCREKICSLESDHGCAYRCRHCGLITCVDCLSEGLCPVCSGKPPQKKPVLFL